MPQINEPAPDLNIAEWVQGKSSNISQEKGKNIAIKVFQVNCPGCFITGFPEFLESYGKFKNQPILFWGLATAFEQFQWNTLDNLKKLIYQGEVVGDALYALKNQGMLEDNYLSYKLPFPIAWDKISPADPLISEKSAKKMIDRDFPNFSQLPVSTQKQINDQVMTYYKDKKYTAETFENYQLRGTPSTILIDKSGKLRGNWFGSGFGLETEIEKLLNEE